MVPGSAQAQRALAAAGVAAALALAGCGGGSSPSAASGAAVGNPSLGNPRLVDCTNWRAGDPGARYGTIREIRRFAGGPAGEGYNGATIPDRTAYRVLDGWCRQPYATYFKLYKLYTRAAAFSRRSAG